MHPPDHPAVFKYSTKLTLLLDIILAAIRFPLKANSNRHIQVMRSFLLYYLCCHVLQLFIYFFKPSRNTKIELVRFLNMACEVNC